MEVQTLTEQMLFVTVRITTTGPEGEVGSGTGFLLAEENPAGGGAFLLVTNKHVVEGAELVRMHFLAATPDGRPLLGHKRTLVATPEMFVGHPHPEVDIAMLGIGGGLEELQASGTPAFFRTVSTGMCATEQQLDAYEPIEPVTFIGYPNGLYDSASFLPIVRQGHAATALKVDYEGKPTFLIDASVFPGSSGSPVFLMPKPSTPDKFGNITLGGPQNPPLLLGVVAAVHQREVPVLQTAANEGISFVYDLIDLGIVYKAQEVRSLAASMINGAASPNQSEDIDLEGH